MGSTREGEIVDKFATTLRSRYGQLIQGVTDSDTTKFFSINNDGSQVIGNNESKITNSNPLYTRDIDGNNRNSLNTVFGEKITGIRVPSFSAQFQYGLASEQASTDLQNGGTAIISNSLLIVSTGTNSAGEARIQTTEYLRYLPGHEAYLVFTGVYTQGVENSWQRAGIFDDDNGFFIGYEGTDFKVTRRRDGTDYSTTINLSTFNYDGGILDPTKGNIYRISFGYLGFATINFEVMTPKGEWILLHQILYPNTSTVTHILQTNLPARAHVSNTGNTSDIVFKSGSYEMGVIDGGGKDASARYFSSSLDNISISAGNYNIVTFRNKSTFNSIENRIKAKLLLASAATDINLISTWKVIRNATFTNTPTWTDVNTTDSTFEYSTDATINATTGEIMLPWTMAKVDSFFEQVENLNVTLKPGETASVLITTALGASGTVDIAFRWKELF